MENQKIFYITNDKEIFDIIIGNENMRNIALATKDIVQKSNEHLRVRVIELLLEGILHKDRTNMITTIKLNGKPCRAIANNFYNLVEIVESYANLQNDYRKFDYEVKFIKM